MANFEDLLAGINEEVVIEVEIAEDDFKTFSVRKLSIDEQKHYKRIINKALGKVSTTERNGFRNSGQEAVAELDIAESGDAEYKAEVYLVQKSFETDGKSVEISDVKKIPSDIFDKVVEKLKELNNLDNSRDSESEVKKQ